MAGRPSRTDVVTSYDLGVESYEKLWGPVILPGVAALLPALEIGPGDIVLDVGAGTGAFADVMHRSMPGDPAGLIALDASDAMLRVAHLTRRLPSALADAMWLPVASRSADVVVLAYVLFHLEDPGAAVAEAARVLRPRGRAGTVTWRSERSGRAQEVWNEALEDSGVPALPPRRVDENLDTIEGIEALLASGGLTPRSTWTEKLERRWDADSFWALVTGSGVNRQRLDQVSPAARTELLEQVRERIGRLGPDDFIWEGEVVCAVASADG